MEFVTDAIGDHIVVMDFVYTTCTTICPVLSALFTQVQTKLGNDVVGNEVRLISMSVDPIRDTPQRLRTGEWKRLFGFPNPDRIVRIVNELREQREAGG